MVNGLDIWIEQSGFKPWLESDVFLGKTLYSHNASLHPGVQMGTGKLFNAGSNPAMDWHPIQGGVEIHLVASCYRHRDKLWPDQWAPWLIHVCRLYLYPYASILNL